MKTLEQASLIYLPTSLLTKYFPRRALRFFRIVFFLLTVTCVILAYFLPSLVPAIGSKVWLGLALVFGTLYLEQMLLSTYHNTYYFHGLNSLIGLSKIPVSGVTYEVGTAILNSPSDIGQTFASAHLGYLTLLRAGVQKEDIQKYLESSRIKINSNQVTIPDAQLYSFINLGDFIYNEDQVLRELLRAHGITAELFHEILEFVVISYHQYKKRDRWWGKDNLSRHGSIGRELAYGETEYLKSFSLPLNSKAIFSNLAEVKNPFSVKNIEDVENALAKERGANVMIIGEVGVGTIDLILEVEKRQKQGRGLRAIEDIHFVLLDTERLFASFSDINDLQVTIMNLLAEASDAGNIVLVIPNFGSFIREGYKRGLNLSEILDSYLASEALHIIATETPGVYHNELSTELALTRRFTEITLEATSSDTTVTILGSVGRGIERKYKVFFTYQALKALVISAERYLVEGVMPDKAVNLLVDIASKYRGTNTTIGSDEVYRLISEKTGIPVGPIEEKEKDLLLNLEHKLHERVVGQEQAISAIAKTMRRARAGIQAGDRPIGSFLFLGPSGVGKTETAKALALVFFGAEANLIRFDMSEFSGASALSRFIGDSTVAGLLTEKLHEHPYSVLLLDEFEKADQSIHDLFLQILDEGTFTNGRGEKVNARNTIIIATSNAGSDLILRTVENRQSLVTLDAEIVNHLLKQKIYRPELINRFANVVIFEPLQTHEQIHVAKLLLKELYDRVRLQGYELVINDDLLTLIVEKGFDPKFGARPLQRAIENMVEEKIAQKIIAGEAKVGDTIVLGAEDLK